MSETRYYKVAGHLFSVTVDGNIAGNTDGCLLNGTAAGSQGDFYAKCMDNYEPFAEPSECHPGQGAGGNVFSLSVMPPAAFDYTEEIRQEDEGQTIICGHRLAGESVFEFLLRDVSTGTLICSNGYREARLLMGSAAQDLRLQKFALNNSLMVLYALATAGLGTALFHSAVVSYKGMGYMFLGKSGTGKSTHARLWLKHIEGSELMNDDNPVVRFFDDDGPDGAPRAVVYGSPWSGKTPCYRNVQAPVGGIVLLSQAPYNKIVRLKGVQAYAALVTSISGKRWDKSVADGLHATENALAKNVPVWHLECLPDEAAAKLCNENVSAQDVIPGGDNNVIPGPDPESRWRLKAAMTKDEHAH
ncbi:MAG: hypothetical protein IKB43_03185 [Fibrobacter sp.]|nr:hypothetical protein [Fibrobacter sp.]